MLPSNSRRNPCGVRAVKKTTSYAGHVHAKPLLHRELPIMQDLGQAGLVGHRGTNPMKACLILEFRVGRDDA